ncbi:MAG: YgfZ/GcvT domain-containing protein [Acidimicrobiales bacterium]
MADDDELRAGGANFELGRSGRSQKSLLGEGRYWGLSKRDVVMVAGPQAGSFLQGQLTQDVVSLAVGSHRWSWLLEPSGKVVALLRVFRSGDEEWALEVDPTWGEHVAARLARFKLRTKAELTTLEATLFACRGEGWRADGLLAASPPWPGLAGVDVLQLARSGGPSADGPSENSAFDLWRKDLSALGSVPSETLEVDRIAVGWPRMGAELTERTIPAETGLVDLTVSFTKGCYTGQELVARIDSRGNHVARRMVRLRPEAEIDAGVELRSSPPGAAGIPPSVAEEGTAKIGWVTSVGFSEAHGWVALGYLERRAGAPTEVAAGDVAVRVLE